MKLTGIHHLTAVTAKAAQNHSFYTDSVGLRLVKRTVNQDDTSAYHLYYADAVGTPGTDLTFFDWPVEREMRGTNSIVRTGFRVADEATLTFWLHRIKELKLTHQEITVRDGRPTLDFEDFEGQRLSLIVDASAVVEHTPWEKSLVPAQYQVYGLGPITISVSDYKSVDHVLTSVMNMEKVRDYTTTPTTGFSSATTLTTVHVYRMGDRSSASSELHVAVEPHLPAARLGAGGVHHVAFRVPTFGEYDEWAKRLKQFRMPSSGPVDRFYFKSLYFREPNGILFELATDEPGFAVDEPIETLGESLSLPPFLESQRGVIESRLKPI